MSVPKPASSGGPEFCDVPPFLVSRYVREYASYMDASRFTYMCASDPAWTVRDHHNVLPDTDVRASVKRWLHCGGLGMSVSRCVGSKGDFPSSSATNRKNLKKICRPFCGMLMGCNSPKLERRFSSYVVHLVTCILPNALIIRCLTASLRFLCFVMRRRESLASIMSNCLPSRRHIVRVATSRLRAGGESLRGLVCFAFQRLGSLNTTPVKF